MYKGQSQHACRLDVTDTRCNLNYQNMELQKTKQNQNRTNASATFTIFVVVVAYFKVLFVFLIPLAAVASSIKWHS